MFSRYLLRRVVEYKQRILYLFNGFNAPLKVFYNQNFKRIAFYSSISGLSYICFSPLIVPVKANSSTEDDSKACDCEKLYQSVKKVSPSIVMINGNVQCSGIVINSEGLVLTSSMAVSHLSSDIEVTITENNQSFSGRVVSVDRAKGLCLVKVHLPDGTILPKGLIFGNDDDVSQGQMVFSVSSPYYLTNSVSTGCITSVIRSDSMIQSNDLIYFVSNILAPSASLGSPLCNYSGEVIGILTREDSGHTLCMPIRHVVDFINQYFYMMQNTSSSQKEQAESVKGTDDGSSDKKSGWLVTTLNSLFSNPTDSAYNLSNMVLLKLSDELKKDLCISNSAYRKLRHGLLVLDLPSNSKLYANGVRKGDVILEANREVIFTKNDFERELKKKRMFLKIVRNNQFHTLKTVYINVCS